VVTPNDSCASGDIDAVDDVDDLGSGGADGGLDDDDDELDDDAGKNETGRLYEAEVIDDAGDDAVVGSGLYETEGFLSDDSEVKDDALDDDE
jgi:hypothetical protein